MFEQMLQRSLTSPQVEKSSIDKFLAKDDIAHTKTLMTKENLTRSELVELLYQCTTSESKLMNLGEWDRYVILKYYVWIQEFIKIAESIFDYKDFLLEQQHTCAKCNKRIDTKKDQEKCSCKEPKPKAKVSSRTWQQLENVIKMHEHNCKFMVSLYLNIGRTSMSLGATAFLEMLKNKWELVYPGMNNMPAPQTQPVQIMKNTGGQK